MTRHYLTFLVTLLLSATSYAQKSNASCNCPRTFYTSSIKADATFHLSNGKTIILCGYKYPDRKQPVYGEFILSVCGSDTFIDFWGSLLTCRLKVNKDTLLVEDLKNLNTGKNFKYQETVWTTEKIYFNGAEVIRKLTINRQIRKYTQAEIKAVLSSFEKTNPVYGEKEEALWDIMANLFVATISGDKTARRYFTEFENKFGMLDGDFGEGYSDHLEMLKQWDSKEELPVSRIGRNEE